MLATSLRPRHAHFLAFLDADQVVIDTGLALFFPAPHSFTGEDVLELHGHGGPVILDMLLRRVLSLGVRLARPGEFSERAFLNDKMDLVQAEAIADLIDSASEQAARSAQRSLQGEFSWRIEELVETLIQLRIYVEASIDFVDEEIDFLSEGEVGQRLLELLERLQAIRRSARQGCILREGLTVVIAGLPNAGKSSLLNALVGREAAIVTDIEGTTRDILREYIQIDGMPLHVVDTAGLRESRDTVEREGVRRAREAILRADLVLLITDDRYPESSAELLSEIPTSLPVTRIRNKIDLTGRPAGREQTADGTVVVSISLKTGEGLDDLRQHLKAVAGFDSETDTVFTARRRHLDALDRAKFSIQTCLQQLAAEQNPELIAEDLRQAQNALAEITGAFGNEDLLDRVFASFCLGK